MADYFESGFTVRERSWHGKETVLAEHPENWDAARMAAGLMWEPRFTPLYREARGSLLKGGEVFYRKDETTGLFVEAPDAKAVEAAASAKLVERDDTGKELAAVSQGFELITHAEMGQIMEAFLDEPNVKFDTAGSVREGRQVYATILLDEPYQIAGDVDGFGDQVTTLPYFAILNSHDGTGACKGLYTQVRVVCWNTVQAASADGDRTGAQFSLRHTSGVKERIEDARNIVAGARTEAARWKVIAEQLAIYKVTPGEVVQYLSEFIPEPPAGVVSDRVRDNVAKDRAKFMHTLNESATNSAMADNALGLFNASVEYLDHVRGFRNRETYMGRQILSAEPFKAKALHLIRDLVGAN